MSNTAGSLLLFKLLNTQDTQAFLNTHLKRDEFTGSEVALYDYIHEHVASYGKLPDPHTASTHTELPALPTSEPLAYYVDNFSDRHIRNAIRECVSDAKPYLTDPTSYNSRKALDIITTKILELQHEVNKDNILDYRESGGLILSEFKKQLVGGENTGIKLGWPTFDEFSCGLQGGDLASYVGRPQTGKTFQMLYSAHHVWRNGYAPMFVSLEMSPMPLLQRLAAIDTETNLTGLKKGLLSTPSLTSLKAKLTENRGGKVPLWMMDGKMAATVDDVASAAQILRPSAIFVDGAYLLGVNKKWRLARWERIGEVVERLKKLGTDMDIPVVASWQFSKDYLKSKKRIPPEEVGLEDIAGADIIGHTSSAVLGLFEEDTIETAQHRRVFILKGRAGEKGNFTIKWDFMKMDFTEIVQEVTDPYKFI